MKILSISVNESAKDFNMTTFNITIHTNEGDYTGSMYVDYNDITLGELFDDISRICHTLNIETDILDIYRMFKDAIMLM